MDNSRVVLDRHIDVFCNNKGKNTTCSRASWLWDSLHAASHYDHFKTGWRTRCTPPSSSQAAHALCINWICLGHCQWNFCKLDGSGKLLVQSCSTCTDEVFNFFGPLIVQQHANHFLITDVWALWWLVRSPVALVYLNTAFISSLLCLSSGVVNTLMIVLSGKSSKVHLLSCGSIKNERKSLVLISVLWTGILVALYMQYFHSCTQHHDFDELHFRVLLWGPVSRLLCILCCTWR